MGGGALWIKDKFKPVMQRKYNKSIMEQFIWIPNMMKTHWETKQYLLIPTGCNNWGLSKRRRNVYPRWNAVRWLVCWLIPEVAWTAIPTKMTWVILCRLLQAVLCITKSPWQITYIGMTLDQPLGLWYTVSKNIWFPCSKSSDRLYLRGLGRTRLQHFRQSTTSGFYIYEGDTIEVPITSHPVSHCQVMELVWTQKPYNLAPDPS